MNPTTPQGITGNITNSAESYGIQLRESLDIRGYLWGAQGTPDNLKNYFRNRTLGNPTEPYKFLRESQEILRILQNPTDSYLGNPWISVDIYREPREFQNMLRKTSVIVGKLRKFRESETIPGNPGKIEGIIGNPRKSSELLGNPCGRRGLRRMILSFASLLSCQCLEFQQRKARNAKRTQSELRRSNSSTTRPEKQKLKTEPETPTTKNEKHNMETETRTISTSMQREHNKATNPTYK